MDRLTFSLVSDGSSDRALLPILRRLLEEHLPRTSLEGEWADLRRLPVPPKPLSERIAVTLQLYPCRILFVHRDAEGQGAVQRREEIRAAVEEIRRDGRGLVGTAVVCAVPVRMLEAWLLVDEGAIRRAAGNPHGPEDLDLPAVTRLEDLPDPKSILHEALRTASGLRGVRRKRFAVHRGVHRVADFLDDLGSLRQLDAFRQMEADLEERLEDLAGER